MVREKPRRSWSSVDRSGKGSLREGIRHWGFGCPAFMERPPGNKAPPSHGSWRPLLLQIRADYLQRVHAEVLGRPPATDPRYILLYNRNNFTTRRSVVEHNAILRDLVQDYGERVKVWSRCAAQSEGCPPLYPRYERPLTARAPASPRCLPLVVCKSNVQSGGTHVPFRVRLRVVM